MVTSERFLSSILHSYSALVPVKNLSFPSNIPFHVAHEFLLRRILLNHHLEQYPPSESYQQSFWKWAIVQLESLIQNDEDDEIDECIYAYYLSLKTAARSELPASSFITHYWRFSGRQKYPTEEDCHKTITLLESRTTIEAGTTGLRTWRASLVLAQYLTHHSYLVDTSNVLELGSGAGFMGILIASLQLHATIPPFDRKMPSVCLTDVNSTVLVRCQNNVQLTCNESSSHPNVQYKALDWLDSLSDPESLISFFNETKANIVLGADIVFDPVLVPPLVKTISLAVSSPIQVAFIALTVRNEETLRYFLDEMGMPLIVDESWVTLPHDPGKALKTEEVAHDIADNLLLQTPDQVDAKLEVKIFKITRGRNKCEL